MQAIRFDQDIKKLAMFAGSEITKRDFTFVVAKSLTDIAKMSQKAVQDNLPKQFTIRRNWVVNGIRIKSANKTDLSAVIYSKDSGGDRKFMSLQEFGGTKTPVSRQHVAIPTKLVKVRPTTLIKNRLKPKSLLAVPVPRKSGDYRQDVERFSSRYEYTRKLKKTGMTETFIHEGLPVLRVKDKRGGNKEWILISRKVGKKTQFRAAWLLAPRAEIKETNFLENPVTAIVRQNTYNVFHQNLINVWLANARRGR